MLVFREGSLWNSNKSKQLEKLIVSSTLFATIWVDRKHLLFYTFFLQEKSLALCFRGGLNNSSFLSWPHTSLLTMLRHCFFRCLDNRQEIGTDGSWLCNLESRAWVESLWWIQCLCPMRPSNPCFMNTIFPCKLVHTSCNWVPASKTAISHWDVGPLIGLPQGLLFRFFFLRICRGTTLPGEETVEDFSLVNLH